MTRRSCRAVALALALPFAVLPAFAADETARLHALFDREWERTLRQSPLLATGVGRHEYDNQLGSVALSALEKDAEADRATLKELAAIDRSRLGEEDAVSYDIFREQIENGLKGFELGAYQMPFNADSGFHIDFGNLASDVPLQTVKDYENYIARLKQWPRVVGEQIDNLRLGLKRGFTVPKAVLTGYDKTITSHIVDTPEKSAFYKPFTQFPASFSAADRERLAKAGKEAVGGSIVPGYKTFLDFFLKEYQPGARETIGAADLPNGAEFYQQQIHRYTSLDLTARQIHEIGLAEVDRIGKEMREVIRQVGFQGDFAAFLKFLRTDPRFYAKTPDELLMRASWIAKRMDGKLPALFKTIPRMPYTVEPVPAPMAPKYTSGRYVDAPEGGTRSGIYWVNTYALESRPLYNLEALTLHESVPGHHLQNARARELGDLPIFRRFYYLSSFGEGWGLYSEWLGLEAGFYTDPYSNFGRLTYEMWRACRLVVDTGIHAMGWTRQQTIDYMASHTALPLHEVETETDRYISWPGQAVSYKLGEIKIKELRKRAEAALGGSFDVREFHDVVLGHGAVPLGVLEKNVDAYIARVKATE